LSLQIICSQLQLKKKLDYQTQKYIGLVDYIFIATEPDGLKLLNENGFNVTLVYPEKELRNEYLDRYIIK